MSADQQNSSALRDMREGPAGMTVAELGPFDAIDARLYALFPIPEAEPVRRCRKALMQTSIRAMSRLGNARDLSDEAIMLERIMHNLAGQFTFRRGDDDAVHEAARLCLRLRMCATQLDKLEGGYAIG